MLENDYKIPLDIKASLVSIISSNMTGHTTEEETNHSLMELRELMKTLGIETGDQYIQKKENIEPASILGFGKLQEIAQSAKEEDSGFLVFDCELSASQIRNIKKITGLEIIDRCNVILEIFAQHARTKEASIQVEISRLQYLLPRLSGMWTHLGRQRGGVGVKGGEGEQQIELDRRIIRNRIAHLEDQLITLKKSRQEQRKRRENNVVTAALVGYTNAGKSSLMNRLCKVDVLEENKLFATLDSTFRTLNPDSKPPMVLIDTVGFIQNLPNTLVNGFKTTLESALEASLLIIVCDISDQNYEKHLEVTKEVLEELGLEDKDRIIVFNKADQVQDRLKTAIALKKYANSYLVSTYKEEDMDRLRDEVIEYFLSQQNIYELFIPYDDGQAHSQVSAKSNVLSTHYHENGTFYKIRIPDFIFNSMGVHKYLMAPDDPLREELKI